MKNSKFLKCMVLAGLTAAVLGAGSAEAAGNTYTMDTVYVNGEKDNYIADGYMSSTVKVGMMSGKDTMDIPNNVTSITQKAIKDFAIGGNNEMMDILTFSPSVRRTTSPNLVAIRGKQVSASQMNINGISGLYSHFGTGLNAFEKIDVTSGPAQLYMGSSTQNVIGGVVGLQTKRAGEKPLRELGLKYTSDGNMQEAIDVSERFGEGKDWGIRVNALNRAGSLAVHDEKLKQRNVFVNIDHHASDSDTNLFAGYAYMKHNGGNMMFQPTPNGKADKIAYIPSAPKGSHNMTPGWAVNEEKTWVAAFNHEQKINDHWSAFLNAGLMRDEKPMSVAGYYNGQTFSFKDHFDGSFTSTFNLSASQTHNQYVGTGLKSKYDFGFMKNDLLIGVDKSYAKNWTSSSKQFKVTGNLYRDNNWDNPGLIAPDTYLSSKYTTDSFTIIDTMSFFDDRLQFTAGMHHQNYHAQSYNKSGKQTGSQKYHGTSPNFGLVYKFTPDFSIYANHSETFLGGRLVGSSYANAGELLDPAKTKSNEFGFKFKTGRMLNTISFFRSKEPGAYADSNNVYGYYGRTLYKGIEFSTTGQISDKLSMMAALGYTRYIWDKSNNKLEQGRDANGIPKWNANLALVYDPNDSLSILGRMSFVGGAKIHYGAFEVPSNTRFDLGIKYRREIDHTPVTFSAMCYNVFDKKGWYTADQGNQLIVSDPRTFVVSATFDF